MRASRDRVSAMADKDALVETLKSVAVRRGMSLWSLKPQERALLLMAFTQTLEPDAAYTQWRFDERVDGWLRREGGMIRTDFAEFRRALVDLMFVERDAAGTAYRRLAQWPQAWRSVCEAVEGVRLARVLTNARRAGARERSARKRLALAGDAA